MKKKIMSIVLSLALVMGMMISLTSVSFAADPVISTYIDHIKVTGLNDNLEYGIAVKTSKGEPGTATAFTSVFGGTLYYSDGIKPNTSYYLYLCTGSVATGQTSKWEEYTFKTPKVPTPSVSKIVVGKKSMTVKWSCKNADSGFSYVIQYSAKGEKTKTKTASPGEGKLSFTIKSLKKGKKYTVKIKAKSYEGYASSWSKAKTSGKIK